MTRPKRSRRDAGLEEIANAVRERPGPVFGSREANRYTTLPRCAIDLVRRRIEGEHEQLVFLLLFLASGFHPGGVFSPMLEEIGALARLRERAVKAALVSLDRQGAIVWDPRKRLVFLADAAHREVSSTNLVKNWQGQLASFGESPAVEAARAMMRPDTPSRAENREQGTESREPSKVRTKGRPAGPPDAVTSHADASDPLDSDELRGWHVLGDANDGEPLTVPIPQRWDDIRKHQALAGGEREQAVAFVVDVLQLAQRILERDVDPTDRARVLARRQLVASEWNVPRVLLRIAVRISEAERTHDARWLHAGACFGTEGGMASTTEVMAANAGDELADHLALGRGDG